ncbi:MAG: ABC transporter permease subunit [Lysinibacillus sp.]
MKTDNPVLLKELKLRFRFFKSVMGLLFYLVTLLIFVLAYLAIVQNGTVAGYIRPSESFILFLVLSVAQILLVLFITPGLTAGSISTEREKQTLNMLLTTTQTSWQIILGKLTSSLAYLALLLLASLPIYSIVFLFGGVAPLQIVFATCLFFLTMIAVGASGVMISTLIRKTIPAMITTYGVSVFLLIFTMIFYTISMFLFNIGVSDTENVNPLAYISIALNPIAAVLSVLSPDVLYGIEETTGIQLPVYIVYIVFCVGLTVASLYVATIKLRVNMKKG